MYSEELSERLLNRLLSAGADKTKLIQEVLKEYKHIGETFEDPKKYAEFYHDLIDYDEKTKAFRKTLPNEYRAGFQKIINEGKRCYIETGKLTDELSFLDGFLYAMNARDEIEQAEKMAKEAPSEQPSEERSEEQSEEQIKSETALKQTPYEKELIEHTVRLFQAVCGSKEFLRELDAISGMVLKKTEKKFQFLHREGVKLYGSLDDAGKSLYESFYAACMTYVVFVKSQAFSQGVKYALLAALQKK